jgi:Glycosyl transferase family 2
MSAESSLGAVRGHSLTAIVPATNRPATLPRCVRAIRAAADGPDEIVVVTTPAGAGPAAARNRGASLATGDVLVFIDADVEVHDDAFTRFRAAFDGNPELIAVFGSYDDAPAAVGAVSLFRNLLHHHVHHEGAGAATTFWAGLGGIRRGEFLRVGGFDEQRFPAPAIEDIELGMRLSCRNALITLDPAIQGTHLKAWSLLEMIRTDFAKRGVPWVELLLRTRERSSSLNLGWRHRLSAGVSVLAVGAAVRRRPAIAAASTVALVALNHRFYQLLWRRAGPRGAVIGVGLHALHHLVGGAAIPAGLLRHVLGRGRRAP